MDYQVAAMIGAAGMAVEKLRADTAALNLANAGTSRAPGVLPYRAARLVVQAGAGPSFASLMQAGQPTGRLALPQAAGIVTLDSAPRMMYEPGHPHADDRGFVAYANIDTLSEMVTLMNATRAYEANIAGMSATRAMALKALEIGGVR
jgi:flagellar basal-body rod protein FlgC